MSTLAVSVVPVHLSVVSVALLFAILMLFWTVRVLRPVVTEIARLIQIAAQTVLAVVLLICVAAILAAVLLLHL